MSHLTVHGFALFLSAGILYMVAAGAFSGGRVVPESERPMGLAVAVLSMVQAGWLVKVDRRAGVKAMAGLVAAGTAALGLVTGYPAVRDVLVQLLFALTISIAVSTSPAWLRGPQRVADEGTPSMRTLAMLAPIGVAAQVILGAGLRYEMLPVWPHISGSLLVGALLLFAGMAALQSYGLHSALRRAGTVLLWVTCMQVTLGMAAYGVRMMAHPDAWTVWLTMAHVVNGALTLGAAMAFALQVYYHVQASLLVREAAA